MLLFGGLKLFQSLNTSWAQLYIHPAQLSSQVKTSMEALLYVCVCVFIKLHITAQSGPVILVILCHSH